MKKRASKPQNPMKNALIMRLPEGTIFTKKINVIGGEFNRVGGQNGGQSVAPTDVTNVAQNLQNSPQNPQNTGQNGGQNLPNSNLNQNETNSQSAQAAPQNAVSNAPQNDLQALKTWQKPAQESINSAQNAGGNFQNPSQNLQNATPSARQNPAQNLPNSNSTQNAVQNITQNQQTTTQNQQSAQSAQNPQNPQNLPHSPSQSAQNEAQTINKMQTDTTLFGLNETPTAPQNAPQNKAQTQQTPAQPAHQPAPNSNLPIQNKFVHLSTKTLTKDAASAQFLADFFTQNFIAALNSKLAADAPWNELFTSSSKHQLAAQKQLAASLESESKPAILEDAQRCAHICDLAFFGKINAKELSEIYWENGLKKQFDDLKETHVSNVLACIARLFENALNEGVKESDIAVFAERVLPSFVLFADFLRLYAKSAYFKAGAGFLADFCATLKLHLGLKAAI